MQHFVPHKAFNYVLTKWLLVSQVEINKHVRKKYSFRLRPDMGDLETKSISGPSVYFNQMTQLSAPDDIIKLHPVYFLAYKVKTCVKPANLCTRFLHAKNRASQLKQLNDFTYKSWITKRGDSVYSGVCWNERDWF
jgi:hypothetical protein